MHPLPRGLRAPVQGPRFFGVRGVRLDEGDEIISMTILRHVDATPGERVAYLEQALAVRRAEGPDIAEGAPEMDAETAEAAVELTPERYAELSAHEQFVLTVSEHGFGKRSSSYEYRVSGRGGKGITAMIVNERNGRLIASFPIEDSDQIMLVTDAGKLIRCPVDDVRIAGRNAQGVRIFKTDEAEKVVSVERIPEDGNGESTTAMAAVKARASRRRASDLPSRAPHRGDPGPSANPYGSTVLDPGYSQPRIPG